MEVLRSLKNSVPSERPKTPGGEDFNRNTARSCRNLAAPIPLTRFVYTKHLSAPPRHPRFGYWSNYPPCAREGGTLGRA